MSKMETFYKAARPDGFDFYTGKTINYRDAIGKRVSPPAKVSGAKAELCTPDVLHASRDPNGVFIGAKLPLSLYRVEGKPVVEDGVKSGFRKLHVIEELNPADVYEWDYQKAAFPANPLLTENPVINAEAFRLLEQWASVRDSVGASVGASIRDSIWASVRDSIRDSVGDSIRASVGASVWASVGASVWDSVGASIWDSIRDSIRASVGEVFKPVINNWKYVEHAPGEYPFQSSCDLRARGLTPSFDGKLWRLHGHSDARVLWQGTLEEVKEAAPEGGA